MPVSAFDPTLPLSTLLAPFPVRLLFDMPSRKASDPPDPSVRLVEEPRTRPSSKSSFTLVPVMLRLALMTVLPTVTATFALPVSPRGS
jgi:hypothetical protein